MSARIQFITGLLAAMVSTSTLSAPDLSAPEAYEAARAGTIKLIDIRTPGEWRDTGVFSSAGRVDFTQGPEHLLKGVLESTGGDKNAPIALICRTGNRTTQAQKFLQQQGFTKVYNVREGMAGSSAGPGWIRRGLPVEPCARC